MIVVLSWAAWRAGTRAGYFEGHWMPFALGVLAWAATYAGYKGWPLYSVLPVGGALVVWNLLYFGTQTMKIATGGPVAYLLRISIIDILQATTFYAAGVGQYHLIG